MVAKVNQLGTIEERLAKRIAVDDETGCWNWTGAVSAGKYGSVYFEGRMQKAHRVMWQLAAGRAPEGMDLDHLCRNTRCCNPAHLEPVTRSENLRRSPVKLNLASKSTEPNKGNQRHD